MIARLGVLLACVPIVLSQVGSAAAAPTQQSPPPQRILLVGDSTAETIYPFLRDAGAARGFSVGVAARIGCGVIDGAPKLEDGRPYIDYFGDTSQCAGISLTLQSQMLASLNPDLVVWMNGWESWPSRVVDDQLVHFGTITGRRRTRTRVCAA